LKIQVYNLWLFKNENYMLPWKFINKKWPLFPKLKPSEARATPAVEPAYVTSRLSKRVTSVPYKGF